MKKKPAKKGRPQTISGLTITVVGMLALSLGFTGCVTPTHYDPDLADQIKDRGISYRVDSALEKETLFRCSGIRVETLEGVVNLRGLVDSQEQMDRAGELAGEVAGVKSVTNNIKVKESVN